MIGELVRQAVRNLTRRTLRTVLTTFGIFVGIVTIVTMVALAAGVQREIGRNVAELGLDIVRVTPRTQETGLPRNVFQAPRTTPITPAVVEELRTIPGVVAAVPVVAIPAAVDLRVQIDGRETRVAPTTLTRPPFAQLQPKLIAGAALEGEERGAILSRNALERLGVGTDGAWSRLVGEPITLIARTSRGEQETFRVLVRGIDDGDRPEITLGYRDAADVMSWWNDDPDLLTSQGFDAVTLRAASLGAVPAIGEAVTSRGFAVTSVQALLDVVNRVFAILQALLAGVGGLALFVASLGVVNTMLMSVYERTREIGIMKATGASRGDVLRLFLVESGILGAIAGVSGLLAGWLLSLLVDWIAHRYLESQQVTFVGSLSYVPWWLAAGALGFSVLVGVGAGLYPAYRAASLDPVAALRHD
ncbi:MAG: permease [Dehalococcoidia bacterium]|nr:MAG: permease [Dehalococcoidia bacterium]